MTGLRSAMARPSFISRAENLEDIVLWRALGHVQAGRYIDIGASEPTRYSVSRGFYDRGWRGFHFEPLPECAARLRAARPDEPVHEVALGDHDGEIDFFRTPLQATSTGVQEHAGDGALRILVPVRTLASFADQWRGLEIHWMKIDVEGMEEQVLRGWDSRGLRPWVIVVEATRPLSTEPAHDAWESIVIGAGYRFALFDGLNRFYVAAEHADLLPVMAAPANSFDLYSGCRSVAWRPFTVGGPLRLDLVERGVRRVLDAFRIAGHKLSWRLTRRSRALRAQSPPRLAVPEDRSA